MDTQSDGSSASSVEPELFLQDVRVYRELAMAGTGVVSMIPRAGRGSASSTTDHAAHSGMSGVDPVVVRRWVTAQVGTVRGR